MQDFQCGLSLLHPAVKALKQLFGSLTNAHKQNIVLCTNCLIKWESKNSHQIVSINAFWSDCMGCISAQRIFFMVERRQHFNGFTVSMVMQTSASLSLLSWSSLPSLGVHSPHESIRRGFLAVSKRDVNRLIIGPSRPRWTHADCFLKADFINNSLCQRFLPQ